MTEEEFLRNAARRVGETFEVEPEILTSRPSDVPGAAHADGVAWLAEVRETLANAWPCKACALPEYAHAHQQDTLPDWVRPHDYEPADRPSGYAFAVIEVVPPEGS